MTVPLALMGAILAATLTRAAWRDAARRRSRALRPVPARLPDRVRGPLDRALQRADLPLSPEELVRWWIVGVAAAAWFAALVVPPLLVPTLVGGVVAGPAGLRLRAGRSDLAARQALPGALDLVVAHLRAGATVLDAVGALAERPGPLAGDFARIRARLQLGSDIEAALGEWGDHRPMAAVRAAAGALCLVARVGGAAAGPLEGLAASLRADDAAVGEARALTAQARVSAIVVGGAPVAYLVFSAMTDPASARVLVDTGVGRICLAVGLGLEALGAWWMYRLVGRRP